MYYEAENKIIKQDEFPFNNGWRDYKIEIGIDDEDYIHLYSSINSYYTYFKIDEVDKFYDMLDDCRNYTIYDEEEDAEYHPDEIDTFEWEWIFDNSFKGNFIRDDDIDNVEKVVRQFKESLKPISIEEIRSRVNELSSMSLAELQRINRFIEKAVANE